jgi:uncharacterized membrane protein
MNNTTNMTSLYKVTLAVYILQALALFTAFPLLIAVVINYVKLDSTRGTWLESHFKWQLGTFWWGLLFYIIGAILHLILIGYIICGLVWLWQVYRVVRGLWLLNQHAPMGVQHASG